MPDLPPPAPMARCVADINWDQWVVEERDTLLFVVRNARVLLIRKRRGLGAGKINGPGGGLEAGETPLDCAIRETQEELCINPLDVAYRGELLFHSDEFPHIEASVFVAGDYEGTPTATPEAIPHWFDIDSVPYDEMWEDDEYWLPHVLRGGAVRGRFVFTGESLLDHKVTLLTPAEVTLSR